MKEFLIPKLYFFISYENLKARLISFAQEIGCIIVDGFAEHHFNQEVGFALIDDQLPLEIIQRLATKLPILAFGEGLVSPLALHHLHPSISLSSFKNIILRSTESLNKNDIQEVLAGRSACWSKILHIIELAAQKDCTVLIQGESGTGKEVVAKTIHRLSARGSLPFLPLNCGAIPVELVESELFGHEKGSFTGAVASRSGKFEAVTDGTLFLDEIGDMPLSVQVKLLRVLQERQFERVGSNKMLNFKGRLISATNQSLIHLVDAKLFREDLFYRLNVLPVYLPALRDRIEDIPIIVECIIQRQSLNIALHSASLELLMSYSWPGNVRQLINLLERAEVFYPHQTIGPEDIKNLLKYEPQYTSVESK
jgi:sigma-54 specific flagellar transcriptional regulator A